MTRAILLSLSLSACTATYELAPLDETPALSGDTDTVTDTDVATDPTDDERDEDTVPDHDTDDDTLTEEDDAIDTGLPPVDTGLLPVDTGSNDATQVLDADSEPRATFLFIPDSTLGPGTGYALYHADAVQIGHDPVDIIEADASIGDRVGASLRLQAMLICDGGAQVRVTDEDTGAPVLTAPCAPYIPTDGTLEDGGRYRIEIVPDGSVLTPVDYELTLTIATVY